MIFFARLCTAVTCLLICTLALAKDTHTPEQQRFIAAEKALRHNQLSEYYSLKSKLDASQYVLTPYLEFADIQRLISQGKFPTDQVREFLASEQNSSLGARLRAAWLAHLAKNNRWDLFLEYYQPSTDAALQCQEIYARYKTSQNAEVLNEAKPLWLYGKSQPEACDLVFTAWRKQGGLTEALVWDRIYLGMEANQYPVVNFLKRYIPNEKQYLVQTWLSTYQDPKLISSDKLFSANQPFLREVQVYGLKRIARQDPRKAASLWNKLEKKYAFSNEQHHAVHRAIAISLAMNHDKEALDWFEKLPIESYDTTAFEWHARAALREGNWEEVAALISQFPHKLHQESTWQYWLARAHEELGNPHESKPIYVALSKERSFAGFMAADRLGIPYALNLPLVRVTDEDMEAIVEHQGIARALELHEMGRLTNANREWLDTTASLSEVEIQAAAMLAYENDWQERAILTLSKAENQNNLAIRFPVLYQKTIEKEAKTNNLNPAWIYAVARRESAFMVDARSPVGATGLMQLMPFTAKQIAKQTKTPYSSPSDLTKPSLNVKLGSAYLNQIYKNLGSHSILATAAYNAGPSRVKQWLPKQAALPADIWIETIPFYETREYVKAVMVYKMIYQDHLGIDSRLENDLEDIVSS